MPHGSNSTWTFCVVWAQISRRSNFPGAGTADDAVGSPALRRLGYERVHDTAQHYYTAYSADSGLRTDSGSQIDSDLRTDADLRTDSGLQIDSDLRTDAGS